MSRRDPVATPTAWIPLAPGETLLVEDRKLRLIVILGALSAFGPLSIDMYLPALPALRQEYATGASQIQLTLSACLLGLAVGQLIAGPFSDALGRRRPLMVGLAAYAVASLLCAVAPSISALVALRFVQGLAGAAGLVIARAIIRDLYEGIALARFFSVLLLVSGSAPILAPLFGGQLLRVTSWRGVFVALAVIGVALLLAALLGLKETLPPERRRPGGPRTTMSAFRRLLTDRAFMGYALAGGFATAALFAYIAGSPFVLQDIYGLSPQHFSVLFGANALGLMLIGQVNARLVSRVPLTRLLLIGLLASISGGLGFLVIVMIGGIGLIGILPALFVLIASLGLVLPNAAALALSRQHQYAGSAAALLGMVQYAIGAVAAPLVGIAGEVTAVPMALVIVGVGGMSLVAFGALTRHPAVDISGKRSTAPTQSS